MIADGFWRDHFRQGFGSIPLNDNTGLRTTAHYYTPSGPADPARLFQHLFLDYYTHSIWAEEHGGCEDDDSGRTVYGGITPDEKFELPKPNAFRSSVPQVRAVQLLRQVF
jgi:hypothetical protein